MRQLAIIGGGAAGFFAAVNLAERDLDLRITLYEATGKLMGKVLVSGGGRCNVTNRISDPQELAAHYPRGHASLAEVFTQFGSAETQSWFRDHGVSLKTESDGRVFPVTDDSRTIYDCLYSHAVKKGVDIRTGHRLNGLHRDKGQWVLSFGERQERADLLLVASGPNPAIWKLLDSLGHRIVPPVPSLFTLRCEPDGLEALSGVSLPAARLQMDGDHWDGPLLLTHVGLSGPAALKLSAWKARELASRDYRADIAVQWNADWSSTFLEGMFEQRTREHPIERLGQWREHGLPKRLWAHLLDKAHIPEFCNWAELGKKRSKALIQLLLAYPLRSTGKNTFKEEFVTAGGVDLADVDLSSFASKRQDGLYLAGEVLDIDAVTGGFNFQAAWSAAYLISQAV